MQESNGTSLQVLERRSFSFTSFELVGSSGAFGMTSELVKSPAQILGVLLSSAEGLWPAPASKEGEGVKERAR